MQRETPDNAESFNSDLRSHAGNCMKYERRGPTGIPTADKCGADTRLSDLVERIVSELTKLHGWCDGGKAATFCRSCHPVFDCHDSRASAD